MRVELVPSTLRLPVSHGRSPGIHVSSLIRAIAFETGVLEAKYYEDGSLTDFREITDPLAVLRMSLGIAWEQFYATQLPDVVDHPGEMCENEIFMTHDGEAIEEVGGERVLMLHEYKLTWKSTNTVGDLAGQWMWLSQLKAYCYALRTTHATIHVYFVCGDYSMPITPQLKRWQIEFTQEEIDANWQLLVEYKKHREGMEP